MSKNYKKVKTVLVFTFSFKNFKCSIDKYKIMGYYIYNNL